MLAGTCIFLGLTVGVLQTALGGCVQLKVSWTAISEHAEPLKNDETGLCDQNVLNLVWSYFANTRDGVVATCDLDGATKPPTDYPGTSATAPGRYNNVVQVTIWRFREEFLDSDTDKYWGNEMNTGVIDFNWRINKLCKGSCTGSNKVISKWTVIGSTNDLKHVKCGGKPRKH